MDPRTRLDHAVFQLTPTRTRCDLVIFAGGSSEKLASGLLEPFLLHLNYAKDQIQKGGYSISLQPSLTSASWFTKATLQRFVRFVNTPEVLERFVTIEREISQIEKSFQSNEQTAVTTETEGNVLAVDECTKKSTASSKSKFEDSGGIDILREESSKVRLQRVLETRRAVLRKEQAMAYARALVAGFEMDSLDNLIPFADFFGASRLREASINFMELCKKKKDDGLWMDELAEMQTYSHSEFPYLANSGIILAGEDNDHSKGIMLNVNNGLSSRNGDESESFDALASDLTLSHGSSEVNQDKVFPKSAHVQSTDGKPQVPMSWPTHVPPYMHIFPGHQFQQMTPYQGYPFPGIQVAPPYYPGNMQWPPNMEGSGLGHDHEPYDRRNHKSYSEMTESSHAKGSQNIRQNDNSWPSVSNSESDSFVKQISRKKHGKRSSSKVVIRNINYITSKGNGGKGSASEGNSYDENEFIETDSPKRHVKEAVGLLERCHKSNSRSKKKQNGIRHRSVMNGSNSASEQDDEKSHANVSKGEKTNENWDIFQNLLMRETDSRSNDTLESSREGIKFTLNMDSEEVTKPLASTDSFIVTEMNRNNEGRIHIESFEARDTLRPISKTGDSTYEELHALRHEKLENSFKASLSDFSTEPSIIKSQKGGDWFPGNQPKKSASWDQDTHHNIFDGDYGMPFEGVGDQTQIEKKNKNDVLVDDSFMVHARPMDNDPYDSQLKTDIYLVSDIVGATQQKMSLPNNSQEMVETACIFEPDDLCMVLRRNSDVEQVAASWNPEMDYGNNNSLTESVERISKVEPADCVGGAKVSSNSKETKSKASGAPGGKALSKEARSKTSVGSLGNRKPELISRSTKQTSSGSRNVIQKSKSEKEEGKKKRIEELLIERQKRIAERSASSGQNPATTKKRTSNEHKTAIVSMKNQKPKLQTPEKEIEKSQKMILGNSTIDRLASAKVAYKLSSTQLKSRQPRKTISKAFGTENKKPSTERLKPSDTKGKPSYSNGLLSAASGSLRNKDCVDATVALRVESSTEQATQPPDSFVDSEKLKEIRSISLIENKGDKVLQRDTLDDKKCNKNSHRQYFSLPIEHNSAQLDYLKGDNEITSKVTSKCHAQFAPEVTVHHFVLSPKKALNSSALQLDEDGVVNGKFSVLPEISIVEVSTPPPDDEVATEAIHSRKKWDNGEKSPKATKGFRKLLLFGRKSRNSTTN